MTQSYPDMALKEVTLTQMELFLLGYVYREIERVGRERGRERKMEREKKRRREREK